MESYKTGKNKLCEVCGQEHGPVTIGLEHGGFIRVPASAIPTSEQRPNLKRKQSRVVTPDIFWPEEEEEGLG
jgi:hypothetical protein